MGINCNSTSLTTMRLLNSLLLIASGAYAKHCGVRINHNARHENVTTYLETRLTANRWAASNDELVFSFYNGDNLVGKETVLTPWQERSTILKRFDFPAMPRWNNVQITQDGENGINFDVFKLHSRGKTIDVIAQEQCGSSWFDKPDPEGVQECFQETVSNDRRIYL